MYLEFHASLVSFPLGEEETVHKKMNISKK